ncbi:MAG TPA: 2-oxoacid:ferredoxin oxidoreductase subunit alpha [Nitrososphaeraceae archaeon]|nr:2-oxoacid:ferredoxin oxidoreductase subunit alpha [Nitrososphaeraceae archaeon]
MHLPPKINNSLNWLIGGAQGSGVDSAANIFSRACAEGGLHVFGNREYYSNIKGEHSYFTVRVSEKEIRSHLDEINILVSFDAETLLRHAEAVTKDGGILYDSELAAKNIGEVPTLDDAFRVRLVNLLEKNGKSLTVQGVLDYASENGARLFRIPYFQLLEEFSTKVKDQSLSRLSRMINVLSLSISIALLGFEFEALRNAIRFVFRSKPKIAEINVSAAEFAYEYAKNSLDSSVLGFSLTARDPISDMILVQGNQSSALGKLTAGCKFQTYYPITPAADDSEFLEANERIPLLDGKEGSILVLQTEDEIAAITMAIGGALTGTRSATATSGPGFSLMAEALGWAGMNEVPLVVSLYQRAGPATGLPTRHEQGDLLFAIRAGHGEFPRVVFASGDIEESYYDSIKIFNFAEKFQMPVIHMLDKAIANSVTTCRIFDQNRVHIDRGSFLENISLDSSGTRQYRRFRLTKNNSSYDTIDSISPRVPVGTENGIFWNTGDEHDEEGHISEDPYIRTTMMNKRMGKLKIVLDEIGDNDKVKLYGIQDPNALTVISWGSTKGAILDAMDKLIEEEKLIRFVQLRLLHPFPSERVKALIDGYKPLVDIEMNYSSQLASLINENLSIRMDYLITKYNGRPMSCTEIYDALTRILSGDAPRRIILERGV